jgi:hypothetical protein
MLQLILKNVYHSAAYTEKHLLMHLILYIFYNTADYTVKHLFNEAYTVNLL